MLTIKSISILRKLRKLTNKNVNGLKIFKS
jgi:hypothetical protein